MLKKTFANPPSKYRSKPFWAWNGKLEAPELRRQIRTMRRMGQRVFLRLSAFRGAGARILVNDQPAGVLAWPPYEADITAFANSAPRAVKLGIEILGHRRNSHGPLHNSQKWPNWTGPGQFASTGDQWCEDYQLVPCGLLKPPEFIIKTVRT